MIGSLIGAGIGAVGSILGGISASKAMKKYKRGLERQKRANEAWYDRRYNENATQRADAQAVLTQLDDNIRRRNRSAAGRGAVAGSTPEAEAAVKAANAQAEGEAAARIVAANEARKDNIEGRYQQRENELDEKLGNLNVAQAQNTAQAIGGVTGTAGAIADGLESASAASSEAFRQRQEEGLDIFQRADRAATIF